MTDYKPVPLRLWFLAMILTLLLSLLILTEIALHMLPDGTKEPQPLYETNIAPTVLHAVEGRTFPEKSRSDNGYPKRWEDTATDLNGTNITPRDAIFSITCTTESTFTSTVTTIYAGTDIGTTISDFTEWSWSFETETTTYTVVVTLDSIFPTEAAAVAAASNMVQERAVLAENTYCDLWTTEVVVTTETITATATTTALTSITTTWVVIGTNTVTETHFVYIFTTEGASEISASLPTGENTGSSLATSTLRASPTPQIPFTTLTLTTEDFGQPSSTPTTTAFPVSSMGVGSTIAVNTEKSVYVVSVSTFLITSTETDGSIHINTLTSAYTKAAFEVSSTGTDGSIHINIQTSDYIAASNPSLGDSVGETFITDIVNTIAGASGSAVRTSTRLAYGSDTVITLTDSNGYGTMTRTLAVLYDGYTTVFSGTNGNPASSATYFLIAETVTLTDESGKSTGISITTMTMTPGTSILTNDQGDIVGTTTSLGLATLPTVISTTTGATIPSSTNPNDPIEGYKVLKVYAITGGQYFVGLILPTLFATLLGIPIRIVHYHARLYQPFQALVTSAHGATASQSLLFATSLWASIMVTPELLKSGQFLIPATMLLTIFSAVLVPLSAEAVRVVLQGDNCQPGQGSPENCAITIGAFSIPATICAVLLTVMSLLTIGVCASARKYRTGMVRNPWNMSALYEMSCHNQLRELLRRLPQNGGQSMAKHIHGLLGGYTYKFGTWHGRDETHYGILVKTALETSHRASLLATGQPSTKEQQDGDAPRKKTADMDTPRKKTADMVPEICRALVLVLLCGLLTLIIVYYTSPDSSSGGFFRFMNGESMGVRILFTSTGIIITQFWTYFFQCNSPKPDIWNVPLLS